MLKYPCNKGGHQEGYVTIINPFDETDSEGNDWSGKDKDVVSIECPECRKKAIQL